MARCERRDDLVAASLATKRQSLLLAALAGDDVLRDLREAWSADAAGWQPPRKKVPCWFYWTLSRRMLGEHNPAWRALAFGAPPPASAAERGIGRLQLSDEASTAAVEELLDARECFVMRGHGVWPAASARWGSPDYLRAELHDVPMHVLGNTAQQKHFHYFREGSEGVGPNELFSATKLKLSEEEWRPPPVTVVQMKIADFIAHRGVDEPEASAAVAHAPPVALAMCAAAQEGTDVARTCLYLQQPLLVASAQGEPVVAPQSARLGPRMRQDIESLPLARLRELSAGLGKFDRSQLFVGSAATSGARSTLHFDQADNLFLQIAGKKRFVLYAPEDAGNLYAWPVHHPLDRRAQVQLSGDAHADAGASAGLRAGVEAEASAGTYPRFARARALEIILEPGDLLFLPAYWWHEVTTLAVPTGEVAVSVSFWFNIDWETHLTRLPLRSTFLLEAVRQLEMLAAEVLGSPRRIHAFMCAAGRQMEALHSAAAPLSRAAHAEDGALWPELHAARPTGVARATWEGLFEFIAWKATLLVGSERALTLLQDLCDPCRFECIAGSTHL